MIARPPVRTLPPQRRHRRWLIIAAAIGVFAATAVFLGVVIIKKLETGNWEVPDTEDLVRVVHTMRGSPPAPSKTIFLERDPIELSPGIDDARRGISSVLRTARNKPTKLPGWKGGAAGWKKLMTCVTALFAPFDVTVSDRRPTAGDFVLVAVGGRPGDIGVASKRVGGLAPFNGDVISNPVVFAFSTQLGNDVRAVCETIGMEVAHAYGLDHGYECEDVMTYLAGCGAKRFVDKDVPCGEIKKRTCEGGALTQNSHKRLLAVLGARAK